MEEIVIRHEIVFANVGKAAKRLGVTRTHLSRVLKGERISEPLMRRMAKANIRLEV